MNRSIKIGIGAAIVAILAWLAFGIFGIHTAFIDNEVSEDNPFANVTTSAQAAPAEPADAPADQAEAATDAPADEPADADSAEDDAAPAAAEPEAPAAPAQPEIVTLASGTLVDHSHQGDGTVNVLTDGNQTFLRFEDDFDIDNGPDLNVYLVRGAEADGDPSLFDDDFIDLGDLKGNIGAQNYELDPSIDITEYDTVVIWCVRFGVAFNAAALT